jgi:hypothetical protein
VAHSDTRKVVAVAVSTEAVHLGLSCSSASTNAQDYKGFHADQNNFNMNFS